MSKKLALFFATSFLIGTAVAGYAADQPTGSVVSTDANASEMPQKISITIGKKLLLINPRYLQKKVALTDMKVESIGILMTMPDLSPLPEKYEPSEEAERKKNMVILNLRSYPETTDLPDKGRYFQVTRGLIAIDISPVLRSAPEREMIKSKILSMIAP